MTSLVDESALAQVRRPRGRWAPTPSGLLHVGNARTALVAWLSIRSRGGSFVWRLEDLDPPRVLAGAADTALEDLRWLGLDWDEGPDVGGPCGPYVQSERSALYERALRMLFEADRLFPCKLSRKDLRELTTAPHGAYGAGHDAREGPDYPPELRPNSLPDDWFERFADPEAPDPDAALRFRVDEGVERFVDLRLGHQEQDPAREVGDFVLKRRDGLYAYQLAVVVDDLAMGIDEVVRGVDLLDSTGRQMQLVRALGGAPPTYAHVPLLLDPDGEKLSKRHESLTLADLRRRGADPAALCGYLAWTIGLLDQDAPCRPADLVESFSWERLSSDDHLLPADDPELSRLH